VSGTGARTAVAPAAAGLFAVAGVAYLLAGVTESPPLLLACGAALALPVVALALRPRTDGVVLGRLVPPRLPVGASARSTLIARNDGHRRSPELLVRDTLPGFDDVRVVLPPLEPGEGTSVTVARTALRRQRADAGALGVEAVGPFGLSRVLRDVELDGEVRVHPAPARPPALPLPAWSVVDGGRPTGRAGPGTEVLQLRDWRPGDGARAVSARASARHGRPVVVDREADGAGEVVVLLTGRGSGPAWEDALASACAAAVRSVGEGRRAWLLASGHEARPGPGPRDVLDWFAAADDAEPLEEEVLRRAVGRARAGGVLVAVAPVDDVAERMAVRRAAAAAGVPLVVLGD
jgi:uncharacterized protein (DUF58 family)